MLKAIKTKKEHEAALEKIYGLMQKNIKPGSQEGNELEALSILVEKYEDEHYPIPPPDPIEAIKICHGSGPAETQRPCKVYGPQKPCFRNPKR